MLLEEARRAVAAARFVASAHDLPVDEAVVLRNSNRLAVRLLPCDVLARVAPSAEQNAAFEVELAQRLADANSPVAALEPRVEPGVYERDGFAITLWTYYEEFSHREVSPPDYANALARLHAGMRSLQLATPHFTDRVAEAEALVANPDRTPTLAVEDREILKDALRSTVRSIADRRAAEQVLHGEPHPGNLLNTKSGLRFIDLETCCRGPVEFDLAHVPAKVVEHYPNIDQLLLNDCRGLVLAMVAALALGSGRPTPKRTSRSATACQRPPRGPALADPR